MNAGAVVEQLLEDAATLTYEMVRLSDEVAGSVVERLKQEADRHWAINANRSLEIAGIIIAIGEARGDPGQTALGMMARGDALKFLGRIEEAWTTLDDAGRLFLDAGDEVGWARTRIGRLPICVDLNRVDEALADAEQARTVFIRHDEREKLLRLDVNTAIAHGLLGNHQQALTLYGTALETAEGLGDTGRQYLGMLYTITGVAYEALGDYQQALSYHERARDVFEQAQETRNVAIAETNIANIAKAQGHYRHALSLLHRAHDLYVATELLRDAAEVNRIIVECELLLNRYASARDLAQRVSADFQSFGATFEEALTRLHLATAEAELGNYAAANEALNAAERIFAALNATSWSATARLRRGRIALQQHDIPSARQEARAAAAGFESAGQQVNLATATLLEGQIDLATGDAAAAVQAGRLALDTARRRNVPGLRYTAHLLLGHANAALGNVKDATRRYHAAAATVDRMQRGLTITLRPGFLEDKEDAHRALIGLHLRHGQAARAFETLERAKSQVLLSYLANREQLRWASADQQSRTLIADLNRLRGEHHTLYRAVHEPPATGDERADTRSPQQLMAELSSRERRMRDLTEKLYLHSPNNDATTPLPSLAWGDIQRSLNDDTVLVEFYNDGTDIWAFTLDAHTLEVHRLPTTAAALDRLIGQLQVNFGAAIGAGHAAYVSPGILSLGQRMLQRLHSILIAPLAERLRGRSRLVIVPYGALHYLPFHVLFDGRQFLIEHYEVVLLPAGALSTRRSPQRAAGARILAHSWDQRLPQTLAEGRVVQALFGGELYCDEAAQRSVLQAYPTQILHIAAHGEHRLDQPDLSFIQLDDGQLYTDDLLQQDLSYELVTLSACETGRANVAAGDELIGLGRGFLYAGAGALIVGLWRVADDTALTLMERVYQALRRGASKAAALRAAQQAAIRPDLHPAYWGVFQLIGDANPLSTTAHRSRQA